jgi:hypothetical protein
MSAPEARRAYASLTTHGKGIAGFWAIDGRPGIWVWRKSAKNEAAATPNANWVVARMDDRYGMFSRETKLEQFFGF